MKKNLLLAVLLVMAALLLTACGAPEETDPDPSPTEVPTQAAPTFAVPTAEPTASPRPMEGSVEWPEPDATLMEIDPVDKPTRPPLVLGEYRTYESDKLRVSFKVPIYFGEPEGESEAGTNYITFSEPAGDIKSGIYPATVTISVTTSSTVQTTADAERSLNATLDEMRAMNDTLETSSTSTNRMLGVDGVYVTFWIEQTVSEAEDAKPVRLRGRCLVVPVDKKLYMVQYTCPADYNSDYQEVYKEIRTSFKEL